MNQRFVSIWFRSLQTDWFTIRQPFLRDTPFVLAAPDHGRLIIVEANSPAIHSGVFKGMVVADARAIIPSLHVIDYLPQLPSRLLKKLSDWCIRYTPIVSIDENSGLFLDATGCSHLWGGEELYLHDIANRFSMLGYHVQVAIADTIGTAWAVARYNHYSPIVPPGGQLTALLPLPAAALRLDSEVLERLQKLGLRRVQDFINMPRHSLTRRFGACFTYRLDQALGKEEEFISPVQNVELYQERLPSMEPIVTATGIEIGLEKVLTLMCNRLLREQKGLRIAKFTCFRIDGNIQQVQIGTNRPSNNLKHLLKLFDTIISTIEPALGIDVFLMEALNIEDVVPVQESLWHMSPGLDNMELSELMDRVGSRIGKNNILRFIPAEHHWPERSVTVSATYHDNTKVEWKKDRPRPVQLLGVPELIEVTAPIPDYPPMMFRYKKQLHKVVKADGPERIEPEWWIHEGLHRDYYSVEDEQGNRYWIFRLGHYDQEKNFQWFMHGFFA